MIDFELNNRFRTEQVRFHLISQIFLESSHQKDYLTWGKDLNIRY